MPVDQDDSKHPGYATQRRLCFTGAGVPVAVHERLHACVARSTGLLPAALLSKDQLGGSATVSAERSVVCPSPAPLGSLV